MNFSEFRSHRQLSPSERAEIQLLDVAQAHLRPNLRSGVRHYRVSERGRNPQRFRCGVKHSRQTRAAIFILLFAERPRFVFYDVSINCSNQSPHGFERARKLKLIEQFSYIVNRSVGGDNDRILAWQILVPTAWYLAFEISIDHGQRPAGQIS